VRYLPSGDTGLVVEFGDRIDRAINDRVVALDDALRAASIDGVVETVPTYRSLMIHYDPLRIGAAELTARLDAFAAQPAMARHGGQAWRIPTCYQGAHAPDLAEVAARTGLTQAEVVALHSATPYHVYMIGFVPGFAYMGDVPAKLELPRRDNPRVKVPAGSVGIALSMTGIYPLESPGGWHLLGKSPIRLSDFSWPRPILFSAGDTVEFVPIDEAEFDRLRRDQESGRRWEAAGGGAA
jgi:KipI family sensor histidine kinase inhibitor